MGEGETLARGQNEGGINPLVGFRGRDDLSRRRETMADFLGQIPSLPKLFDILLPDGEAIHLSPAPDPDIFRKPFWAEKRSAGALGLERKGMDEWIMA